jgi:hypothetical protein
VGREQDCKGGKQSLLMNNGNGKDLNIKKKYYNFLMFFYLNDKIEILTSILLQKQEESETRNVNFAAWPLKCSLGYSLTQTRCI